MALTPPYNPYSAQIPLDAQIRLATAKSLDTLADEAAANPDPLEQMMEVTYRHQADKVRMEAHWRM